MRLAIRSSSSTTSTRMARILARSAMNAQMTVARAVIGRFISASYRAGKSTEGGHMTKIAARRSFAIALGVPARRGTRPTAGRRTASPRKVDNPWFPLHAGHRATSTRGVKDGKPSRDVMTVTHATRMIQGVPCVVVERPALPRAASSRSARPTGTRRTRRATSGTSARRPPSSTRTASVDEHARAHGSRASTAREPGIYMPAHPRVGQSGPPGVLQGPRGGPLQGARPDGIGERAGASDTRC